MSIQYSGNAQTSTFTPTTKQNIIDDVETALLAAGWTTVSGHATTNLLMQSATTPQGYAIRVRLKDNSGTSVQFSIESTDGVVVGTNNGSNMGANLNPNSGSWIYKVVACKYQAFIFASPYPSVARSYVGFGVPFVPSWLTSSITRVGWCQGNSIDDSTNTVADSFRTCITPNGNNGSASGQVIINGTTWTYNGGQTLIGVMGLCGMCTFGNAFAVNGYRWFNTQPLLIDAVIGWGSTSVSAEGLLYGQLWDAAVSSDALGVDNTATFDSHNWYVIGSSGGANGSLLRGSLLVATS